MTYLAKVHSWIDVKIYKANAKGIITPMGHVSMHCMSMKAHLFLVQTISLYKEKSKMECSW